MTKFLFFVFLEFLFIGGCHFSNSTETLPQTTPAGEASTGSEPSTQIIDGAANATGVMNVTANILECRNMTCYTQSWNETSKSNYTVVADVIASLENSQIFRLQNGAAIAAGVFLISAIVGYLSCVGYRRYLERKYGDGQILVAEEAYDTTDLRYFEI